LGLTIQVYALIINNIEIRGSDPDSRYYYSIRNFHLNLMICLMTSVKSKSIINFFKNIKFIIYYSNKLLIIYIWRITKYFIKIKIISRKIMWIL